MTAQERIYSSLESGLLEYKSRKIDWNAYEENKLISSDLKHILHTFENEESSICNNGFYVFEILKNLKDFVARLKILIYAEKFIRNKELLGYWKSLGFPFLDLLLLDSVNLDLEAYQKCKILLILSDYSVQEATQSLLSFLKHCCNGNDKDGQLLGSLWLQFFLELPENRSMFTSERIDFLKILILQLKVIKSNQVQYQYLFCIWLLTFEPKNCRLILTIHEAIPYIIDVAKVSVKEKVVRIVISSLNNFMRFAKDQALPLFIGSKVPAFVETLLSRTYSDEEFRTDIISLAEELKGAILNLSTFDEYASEIKSGQLEWSPPHKSDLFWVDNAAKLERSDLEILKCLALLLEKSDDPEKLAIACNDIGQYIEHVPLGKRNVEKLGIKQSIMKLIAHEDSEVRYFALNTVQKYMSNLWATL